MELYLNRLNKRLIWEILKINIKEYSISHSVKRSVSLNLELKDIQNDLDSINNLITENYTKGINVEDLELQRNILQSKLVKHYKLKSEGIGVRSRAKWIGEGEKNSKYFLSLEKQRQSNNVIRKVKDGDEIVSRDTGILKSITQFYETLYSKKTLTQANIDDYLASIELPELCTEDTQSCDSPFCEQEFETVISELKLNKSPGLDGLTPEFYKQFWNYLKIPYLDMIAESFSQGVLPESIRKSVVTLIYKKGDRELLQNYRPISLSNYDYKILSFVLAKRLQKVIHNLISTDQTGYIKKRNIATNIRIISDVINKCEHENIPAAVIGLDFEKAFDSLNWEFMLKTVKKFGFGNFFCKWINILYTKPTLIVKNNGWTTKNIFMEKGIRQGCPLSALLFILSVECLSSNLRKSKSIEGVKIGDIEIRTLQYADDTTLILANETSIVNALKVIQNFTRLSGLKLNLEKCEGIWLGSLKNRPQNFHDIKFTSEPIKILGVYVGIDSDKCISQRIGIRNSNNSKTYY